MNDICMGIVLNLVGKMGGMGAVETLKRGYFKFLKMCQMKGGLI